MINTASKLALGIIAVLVMLWWFRYDYIAVGPSFIFRIDRFTKTTSVADVASVASMKRSEIEGDKVNYPRLRCSASRLRLAKSQHPCGLQRHFYA